VGVGEDGDEGFGEEWFDVESVGGAAVAEKAGVEVSFVERLDDAGGVGLGELELDFWVEAPVLTEHGGQWGEHGGADEADAEKAKVSVANAAGFGEVFLYVAKGAAGALEEDFSGGGEFDGA
jgi:hypothetical protein